MTESLRPASPASPPPPAAASERELVGPAASATPAAPPAVAAVAAAALEAQPQGEIQDSADLSGRAEKMSPLKAARPYIIGAVVLLGLSVAAATLPLWGALLLPVLGIVTAAAIATASTVMTGVAIGGGILFGLSALALAILAIKKGKTALGEDAVTDSSASTLDQTPSKGDGDANPQPLFSSVSPAGDGGFGWASALADDV